MPCTAAAVARLRPLNIRIDTLKCILAAYEYRYTVGLRRITLIDQCYPYTRRQMQREKGGILERLCFNGCWYVPPPYEANVAASLRKGNSIGQTASKNKKIDGCIWLLLCGTQRPPPSSWAIETPAWLLFVPHLVVVVRTASKFRPRDLFSVFFQVCYTRT